MAIHGVIKGLFEIGEGLYKENCEEIVDGVKRGILSDEGE